MAFRIAAALAGALSLLTMTAGQVEFEVASVKPTARARGGPPPVPQGPPQDPATIRPTCGLRLSAGSFAGDAVTVAQLVEGLAPFVERIVVDRTGLAGYFDVDLEWTHAKLNRQLPHGST